MAATHPNSTVAFAQEREDGKLGHRAAMILDAARRGGTETYFTDRQMMAKLGFTDMNAVRPRITELIDIGLLVEVGAIRCPVTSKKVRVCRAALPTEVGLFRAKRRYERSAEQLAMDLSS